MEQKTSTKHKARRFVVVIIMILTMIVTSSSAYAASSPVFHMSIYVHNWRGDITTLESAADIEVIEEVSVYEEPEPTEEFPVDADEPDPIEETIVPEGYTDVVDEEPGVEDILPVDIAPAPTVEDMTEDIITEEPINTEQTEGEIYDDETMEPEG